MFAFAIGLELHILQRADVRAPGVRAEKVLDDGTVEAKDGAGVELDDGHKVSLKMANRLIIGYGIRKSNSSFNEAKELSTKMAWMAGKRAAARIMVAPPIEPPYPPTRRTPGWAKAYSS